MPGTLGTWRQVPDEATLLTSAAFLHSAGSRAALHISNLMHPCFQAIIWLLTDTATSRNPHGTQPCTRNACTQTAVLEGSS